MAPLKGVFFDFYGTLVCYGDVEAAWRAWLGELYDGLIPHGLSESPSEFARAFDGFLTKPEPERRNAAFTVYEARLDTLCGELGLDVPANEVARLANAAASSWHQYVHLDPESHDVLENLRSRSRLALITNFDHPPYVERLLADLGLTGYFDAIVISGAVGVKKPDPAIFHIALDRLGLDASEAVHVGDTDDDIDGALAAGLQPILIARDSRPHQAAALDFRADAVGPGGDVQGEPDSPGRLTIRSLSELPPLVASWGD